MFAQEIGNSVVGAMAAPDPILVSERSNRAAGARRTAAESASNASLSEQTSGLKWYEQPDANGDFPEPPGYTKDAQGRSRAPDGRVVRGGSAAINEVPPGYDGPLNMLGQPLHYSPGSRTPVGPVMSTGIAYPLPDASARQGASYTLAHDWLGQPFLEECLSALDCRPLNIPEGMPAPSREDMQSYWGAAKTAGGNIWNSAVGLGKFAANAYMAGQGNIYAAEQTNSSVLQMVQQMSKMTSADLFMGAFNMTPAGVATSMGERRYVDGFEGMYGLSTGTIGEGLIASRSLMKLGNQSFIPDGKPVYDAWVMRPNDGPALPATLKSADLFSYVVKTLPSDLVPDSRGVYGYVPKEGTQFAPPKWPVDWTNVEQVANARGVRLEYHQGLADEVAWVDKMRADGVADESIARQIVDMRNQTRMSKYSPEQLPVLYERNMGTYGNPYGPAYETLLAKYGSPQGVIASGTRSNPTMDILTGIAKFQP